MMQPLGVVEGVWVGEVEGVALGEGVADWEGVASRESVGVGLGVADGKPHLTTLTLWLLESATRKLPVALGGDTPLGTLKEAR
jgi:hypothetical protein